VEKQSNLVVRKEGLLDLLPTLTHCVTDQFTGLLMLHFHDYTYIDTRMHKHTFIPQYSCYYYDLMIPKY